MMGKEAQRFVMIDGEENLQKHDEGFMMGEES